MYIVRTNWRLPTRTHSPCATLRIVDVDVSSIACPPAKNVLSEYIDTGGLTLTTTFDSQTPSMLGSAPFCALAAAAATIHAATAMKAMRKRVAFVMVCSLKEDAIDAA